MYERNRVREKFQHVRSFCRPRLSLSKITGKEVRNQLRRGQVVVEYVLLLVVAVAIFGLAMKSCVSRQEDDAGVVIQFWDDMIKILGSDFADEP